MNVTCVCDKCRHHESEPVIEINFAEGKIFWYCPECKKMNEIAIEAKPQPLPRIRTRR